MPSALKRVERSSTHAASARWSGADPAGTTSRTGRARSLSWRVAAARRARGRGGRFMRQAERGRARPRDFRDESLTDDHGGRPPRGSSWPACCQPPHGNATLRPEPGRGHGSPDTAAAFRPGQRFARSPAGRPTLILYGTTELTEVPQLARPSLVPPQVARVRVNAGGRQFGDWMYSVAK